MYKFHIVALAIMTIAINTTAQIMQNATARYYLPTASSFTQSQIDSYNVANLYMVDITNGQALTYPDLTPIQLTWNGTEWSAPQPVAITSPFSTTLMVGTISHQATATAGALYPTIVVDWADVVGTTQYRFRIRPVGGSWNPSTITGSQRTLTTLAYSTTYEVQIRVYINSSTQGEYSQTYTFTTPNYVPLPPCNAPVLDAEVIGGNLIVSYSSVPQAVGYQIEVRQLNTQTWGGTTIPGTNWLLPVDTTKAYEVRVRTNCIGASTIWSQFTTIDTASKAVCQPPTNLYNVGNTFYWSDYQYSALTQIQTRLYGTATYGGGTSTTTGSFQNKYLWGKHEWRVRSRCYGTASPSWTDWSYGVTGFIPQPLTMDEFNTELAYPNPASDQVNLKGNIIIRDLTGRVVATGTDILDVSQLADGLYLINGQKLQVKH